MRRGLLMFTVDDQHGSNNVPGQRSLPWKWIVLVLLTVGTTISLFSRFRAGAAFLAFFEDDYFYYLRVAQNIAGGHGSTYDGTHLTNGYHPLWMLVNVALAKVFAGRAFFYALLLVIEVCVLATYWFLHLCFRRYAGDALASGFAGVIAAEGVALMAGGMEIVLTIPLFAILCWYRVCRFQWQPRSAVVYGMLCAALVLSRLDAAIFVACLGLFELLTFGQIERGRRWRVVLAFSAGFLPVLCYFIFNLVLFHTAMPVSGQVKQLRFHHAPSSLIAYEVIVQSWLPLRLFLVLPVLCIGLPLMLQLRRSSGRLLAEHRALVWALLVFPYLEFGLLTFLSDWPILIWYLYPFAASAIGIGLALLASDFVLRDRVSRFLPPAVVFSAIGLVFGLSLVQWRNTERPSLVIYSVYNNARSLQSFAETHPGVYAMGDRAGVAGFLVHRPIVQMEGLMMDKAFLANIREQRELHDVLRDYHVRYYVATNPARVGECLQATEPMAAGSTSPVMRGLFCSTPLDQFRYGAFTTYIFDMQKEAVQVK